MNAPGIQNLLLIRTFFLYVWTSPILVASLILGVFLSTAAADGPADNRADQVRPIPPVGIQVPPEQRELLLRRCREIRSQCESLAKTSATADAVRFNELMPEVLVFPRAVEMTLRFDMVYQPQDLKSASDLLNLAAQRLEKIRSGEDWFAVVGIDGPSDQVRRVVGGFRSDMDDSIQPYGLIVPAGFDPSKSQSHRLDVWLHGRDENVSEVGFLNRSKNQSGQFQPEDTFVLHPYGRYSNAFKFAGETDVFESMAHVRQNVNIDPTRISIRGFSMGGAGCWQLATRYPDQWFAANPGAGFSETPLFLKSFQGEDLSAIPDYQRRLWQWCDSPAWVKNLKHCPTIVYSGEVDRQKQAADVMQKAFDDADMTMTHIIGPKTGHEIHAESKREIESRLKELESLISTEPPRSLHWTTFTTRYSKIHWLSVEGLETHWECASVEAQWTADSQLAAKTENVTELSFKLPAAWLAKIQGQLVTIKIDDQTLSARKENPLQVFRQGNTWQLGSRSGLVKHPGLQGPIDDAFTSRFLFVLPSGKDDDESVQRWIETESEHAMTHWQKHFRGDVRKVFDREVDEAMIRDNHLILFGTPQSNSWLSKYAEQIPLLDQAKNRQAGEVPILIYPNPANPKKYVVINSGFTFRGYDYLNNARQTPKLPDWAVVDVSRGATPRDPGKVIRAGFFDEQWRLDATP
jgi:dienelactone hydrolase